jgi:hypothetical protein
MRVGAFIGAVVVQAMNRDPARRRVFEAADCKARWGVFNL